MLNLFNSNVKRRPRKLLRKLWVLSTRIIPNTDSLLASILDLLRSLSDLPRSWRFAGRQFRPYASSLYYFFKHLGSFILIRFALYSRAIKFPPLFFAKHGRRGRRYSRSPPRFRRGARPAIEKNHHAHPVYIGSRSSGEIPDFGGSNRVKLRAADRDR